MSDPVKTLDAGQPGERMRRAWVTRRARYGAVGSQQYGGQPRPVKPLTCMDCTKLYIEFPLDMVLPDEQWALIHNSPGGVLCANCIVKRAAKLHGAVVVRAVIEFAPPEGR